MVTRDPNATRTARNSRASFKGAMAMDVASGLCLALIDSPGRLSPQLAGTFLVDEFLVENFRRKFRRKSSGRGPSFGGGRRLR
jgi:hypothetical protein